ncbi:MAG: endonuclease V, partial [Spirulinaceae cyanobacterium RM2_2_10]|nr:endonuclease V [Spirulinaceae cyanobacterium RM2_2_10]
MKVPAIESWPQTTAEAIAIQTALRDRVIRTDDFADIRQVAGVDVGFEAGYKIARAAVVVLSFPELTWQEQAIARLPTPFPYVPGFLSFREVPVIVQALASLQCEPDLILCDGQGYAHPRRFGLACHLGVLLDRPTIGVAKSRLIGTHAEPGSEKGNWQPLWHQDEQI